MENKKGMDELFDMLLGIMEDVPGIMEDAPAEIKQMHAALALSRYEKKLSTYTMQKKLTDEQHERAAKAFTDATAVLKAICAEVEGKPAEPKAEDVIRTTVPEYLKPEQTPYPSKFSVGQRVQFKEYDELKNTGFVEPMKPLCGSFATIKEIERGGRIHLKDFTVDPDGEWAYHDKMFKEVK